MCRRRVGVKFTIAVTQVWNLNTSLLWLYCRKWNQTQSDVGEVTFHPVKNGDYAVRLGVVFVPAA